MPINLPNGLIAPESGDSEALACTQIEALFRAVDSLQTEIVEPEVVECVTIPSASFISQGDVDCGIFQASSIVPAGIDASKTSITFHTTSGERIYPCYTVAGANILIETNQQVEVVVAYA